MYLLYEVALYLVLVLGLPFFLFRRKYASTFSERMGHYRTASRGHDVWIHAVSVGETLAAKPVVDEIVRMRPETTIVFTTTTATGQAQAKRLFPAATVTYFPLDFSVAVKRFLDHHRPRLFAAMETEIWPNATRLAAARGIRLVLANGRISDRSFPRYRMARPIVARVLRHYDAILAREAQDAERFRAIGASEVEVAGNVKFDYVPDERPLDFDLLALAAGRPIVVLGSTMEGEDEALLPELLPLGAFIVVAPRKPERFDIVAGLAAMTRRSVIPSRAAVEESPAGGGSLDKLGMTPDILLLDTIGELARIYRHATVAFIGGSLVPTGGHNPIEPAAVGVPTCFGPHMTNFREIASVFVKNGAAAEVTSAREVAAFAGRMIDDAEARRAMGERGRRTVEANRGAAERTARRIVELLP
jgi:3-deoxy-D-manno-octulosonic-acid transferase